MDAKELCGKNFRLKIVFGEESFGNLAAFFGAEAF